MPLPLPLFRSRTASKADCAKNKKKKKKKQKKNRKKERKKKKKKGKKTNEKIKNRPVYLFADTGRRYTYWTCVHAAPLLYVEPVVPRYRDLLLPNRFYKNWLASGSARVTPRNRVSYDYRYPFVRVRVNMTIRAESVFPTSIRSIYIFAWL